MMDVPDARQQMKRLLVYVTGWSIRSFLLQNEYLAAENRILSAHLPAPVSAFRIRSSRPSLKMASGTAGLRLSKFACAAALANLGHSVSDQTVNNILRRYGIEPSLKRS